MTYLNEATEQTDTTLTLQTFIQQILGSNLGQVTVNITYIRFFVVSFGFSKKIPGYTTKHHGHDVLIH
jgi:hypothetical protein